MLLNPFTNYKRINSKKIIKTFGDSIYFAYLCT